MKTLHVILIASLSCLAARAADREVNFTGIAQLDGGPVALIETQPLGQAPIKPIVSVGDRFGVYEVGAINPKTARITLKIGERSAELPLGSAVDSNQPPTFNLKGADSRQVLELYQQHSGRTVLASPSLPAARISFKSGPALSKPAALDALGRALRDQGIIITPRDDKFAFATPVSHVPRLAQIPEPPARAKSGNTEKGGPDEIFPPGLLKFVEADVSQVFAIYQELSGRTLLASPELPSAKITFRTQTELSRAEATWVLDAVLSLATIKMVPEWTKFVYALPATRGVVAPKIPGNPAADKLKESKNSLAAGQLKFSAATPQQALAVYAELIGREPVTNSRPPAASFSMKSQTALHPVEAIYALDALAGLNHLRFVLVGDKQVKIVHESEAGPQDAGKN